MNTSTVTSKTPSRVAWLSYGGLIPFLGLLALQWVDPSRAELWTRAFVTYGAVILSFVGAVHWGIAMSDARLSVDKRTQLFMWSVVPALLAWVATLMPAHLASLLLVAGFSVHLARDRRLCRDTTLPGWYFPLRIRLTVVVCICLIAGAARIGLTQ